MSMPLIRRLVPGDEATLEALVRDRKERHLDPAAATSLLARTDIAVFAAFLDGWRAGFALTHFLPRIDRSQEMAYRHELDVAPQARRRGLGRGLVEAVRDLARERGAMEAWVITEEDNDAAAATYRSAGFAQEGETAIVFGWTADDDAL